MMNNSDSLIYRFCCGNYPTDKLVFSPRPLHPNPKMREPNYVTLSSNKTMTMYSFNGINKHKHESLKEGVKHSYAIYPSGFVSRINAYGCLKEAYSYVAKGPFRLHDGCGGWSATMTS